MHRRSSLMALLAAVAAGVGVGSACADEYPSRPITMVVPFAAGGGADAIARIVTDAMGETLGQRIIVENVGGAGGTIGSARVAKADPDGYTLLIGNIGTHAASVGAREKPAYDPRTDFAPLGLVAESAIVVMTRKDYPANTLAEFIETLRSEGDKVTNAHAGIGSASNLTCTLFNSLADVKPTLVGYKGNGPLMIDLVGGTVDYTCDLLVTAIPQVKAGAIKALAVTGPQRNPALPDVPTTTEAGMPEFQASSWNGFFAPKGTPDAIVAELNQALVAAVQNPKVQQRFVELGLTVPSAELQTPQGLSSFINSEVDRWAPIMSEAVAAN